MLSTFWLCQELFCYAERFFRSSKHFSSMLSSFLPFQAFFSYAGPFSLFLLCRALHGKTEKYTAEQKKKKKKPLSMEEMCLEEPKSVQHRRKMLGRTEKCSAQKKHAWQSRKRLSIAKNAWQSRKKHST